MKLKDLLLAAALGPLPAFGAQTFVRPAVGAASQSGQAAVAAVSGVAAFPLTLLPPTASFAPSLNELPPPIFVAPVSAACAIEAPTARSFLLQSPAIPPGAPKGSISANAFIAQAGNNHDGSLQSLQRTAAGFQAASQRGALDSLRNFFEQVFSGSAHKGDPPDPVPSETSPLQASETAEHIRLLTQLGYNEGIAARISAQRPDVAQRILSSLREPDKYFRSSPVKAEGSQDAPRVSDDIPKYVEIDEFRLGGHIVDRLSLPHSNSERWNLPNNSLPEYEPVLLYRGLLLKKPGDFDPLMQHEAQGLVSHVLFASFHLEDAVAFGRHGQAQSGGPTEIILELQAPRLLTYHSHNWPVLRQSEIPDLSVFIRRIGVAGDAENDPIQWMTFAEYQRRFPRSLYSQRNQ